QKYINTADKTLFNAPAPILLSIRFNQVGFATNKIASYDIWSRVEMGTVYFPCNCSDTYVYTDAVIFHFLLLPIPHQHN
uniref:Uncharacterized protein n=1 Tax=Ciona intestinalis TaxID=7719 RepID=H2XXF6_CIOIN